MRLLAVHMLRQHPRLPSSPRLPLCLSLMSSSAGSSSSSSSSAPAKEPPLLVNRPSFSSLLAQLMQRSLVGSKQQKQQADAKRRVLVTTPIFYVNGAPHIGHMFTVVLADAFARWRRMCGDDVHLTSGTDEHGLKVAAAAPLKPVPPHALCCRCSSRRRRRAWLPSSCATPTARSSCTCSTSQPFPTTTSCAPQRRATARLRKTCGVRCRPMDTSAAKSSAGGTA